MQSPRGEIKAGSIVRCVSSKAKFLASDGVVIEGYIYKVTKIVDRTPPQLLTVMGSNTKFFADRFELVQDGELTKVEEIIYGL